MPLFSAPCLQDKSGVGRDIRLVGMNPRGCMIFRAGTCIGASRDGAACPEEEERSRPNASARRQTGRAHAPSANDRRLN